MELASDLTVAEAMKRYRVGKRAEVECFEIYEREWILQRLRTSLKID